jgi:hypothetical protein
MGVVALVASGLYFLDLADVVHVDEVVVAVSLWVALSAVWVQQAGLTLRRRLSGSG